MSQGYSYNWCPIPIDDSISLEHWGTLVMYLGAKFRAIFCVAFLWQLGFLVSRFRESDSCLHCVNASLGDSVSCQSAVACGGL